MNPDGAENHDKKTGTARHTVRSALGKTVSRRKGVYLHALAEHIVERCIDREVGRIAVGDLSKIRDG